MRELFFALFILLVPHYAMSQQDTMIVSVNGVDFVMVCGEGGSLCLIKKRFNYAIYKKIY